MATRFGGKWSGHGWRSEGAFRFMDLQQTIVFLVIGGIAGWLAGLILKGGGCLLFVIGLLKKA